MRLAVVGYPVSDQPRFRIPAEVVAEVLGGEAVLLHLGTGRYYALNETGTKMWSALRQFRSCELALPALVNELGADTVTVRGDLERFASELMERGLLELGEPC